MLRQGGGGAISLNDQYVYANVRYIYNLLLIAYPLIRLCIDIHMTMQRDVCAKM